MATPRTRNTRVFTISFPEELAKQVEETARAEGRTVSELFRQAFRTYKVQQVHKQLEQLWKTLPETPYTEEDVPNLVREMRRESQEAQVA